MYRSSIQLRIAEVLSESQLVLNAGSNRGIEKGDEFIVYGLSEKEIIDPATRRSLGKLELYRGKGYVVYVQEKMSILEALPSAAFQRLQVTMGGTNPSKFNNANIGDYAKPNATPVLEKPQD